MRTPELDGRVAAFARATADWSDDEISAYVAAMRRFNEGLEAFRGHPGPRPER